MMLDAIRAVLKTASWISPDLGAFLVGVLMSRPERHGRPEREVAQLAGARRFTYRGASGHENPAWSWGEGPTVLICHGWASRGSQMATMAMAVAQAGYRAVVFDVTAHGDAGGWRSGFGVMAQDTLAVARELGPLYAVVGHSMGGMMAMQARSEGLSAERYVVIGSPFAPVPAVDAIKHMLGAPEAVVERCRRGIAQQFGGASWDELLAGHIYRDPDAPLLLIYDDADDEVPDDHPGRILEAWSGSELHTTHGLGHRKLMWDAGVIGEVLRHLAA